MSEYLTPAEAAEMLSVSRMTIYRYVKTKELPAVKFDKGSHSSVIRIKKEDLEKFLKERKV